MRALVYANHSLSFEPRYPDLTLVEGEALIRVLQAGICNTDLEITRGYMGFQGVPGHEFVGIVEEILDTSGIPSASPLVGKRVVGEINAACHRQTVSLASSICPPIAPTAPRLGSSTAMESSPNTSRFPSKICISCLTASAMKKPSLSSRWPQF